MDKNKAINKSYTYNYAGVAYGYSNINWNFFNPDYDVRGVIFDARKKTFLLKEEDGNERPLYIPSDEYGEMIFSKCGGDAFVSIRIWGRS